MAIKDFLDNLGEQGRILKGEGSVDKVYTSEQAYPTEQQAIDAFARSKEKLFRVEEWSNLSGVSSAFQLYDQAGNRKTNGYPEVGDHIRIDIPGPVPENWVRVTDVKTTESQAEFTVRPSEDPQNRNVGAEEKVEHFFSKEASSTFQVKREGTRIVASEIGQEESINNQGEEAGSRSLLNTVISVAGWQFFQPMQWKKLTDYLVQP